MSAGQKFLFENAFEAPLSSGKQPKAPPPPPEPEVVEPEISEADLEKARTDGRQQGLDQGREEGRAEAFSGIEQTTQTLLLNLTGRVGELLSEQPRMRERLSEEALKAASSILRKILPSLEKSAAIKEIEAVVCECLERAHDEPRLVVRVSEPMLEPVKNRIDALVKAEGFEGKVVFLATDDLSESDVRVEWADGGAERKSENIWRDIDEILGRFLKVPAESLSRQTIASAAPLQAPEPAVKPAAEAPAPAADAPQQAAPADAPPLVSPLEQMGLAPAGDLTTGDARTAPAPVSEIPAHSKELTQTLEKPAATAAAPQELIND